MKKKCSPTTLLQIFCKIIINSEVIVKSIMHTTVSRGTLNPLGGKKGCKVCNVCGQ